MLKQKDYEPSARDGHTMERIILATNVRIKRVRGYQVDLPTGHLRDTLI